jgi:DHA1 family multidrug resistance protein-like MFS transporter
MGLKTAPAKDRSLFPLYLSVFVAVLGFSLVAPIFPLYVIGLGASYTLLGFIISIYGAIQLITQIPMGRLSDRKGRKPLIILGLVTFTLLPPLYIYATNAYILIPIRILGGIGASAVWPLAMAMIVDQVSSQRRGASLGRYNAAFYSAMAIGPLIGGYLYDHYGLQAPFYFWAFLGLASTIIVMARVTEPSRHQAISTAPQKRPKENLILPGYRSTFLACCGVVMWTGIVGGFNVTMLPSYASRLGLSTTEIGLLYLDYAGITAISNIYFGKAADRGLRKLMISAGCLTGLIAFFFLPWASSLTQVLVLLAFIGLSLGIGNPAAAAIIADTTCQSRRGEIFGIFNTSRMSGVVIGPMIAGLVADLYGVNGSIFAFTGISAAITLGSLIVREPRDSAACLEGDILEGGINQ